MLRFQVLGGNGGSASGVLRGAHLLGNDGVPVRGELRVDKGEIICQPRTNDPVALSLLWPVAGYGTVQLETTRLADRRQPYLLNLELARQRLMRITLKREEWGLFDYKGMEEISAEVDRARELFVQAIQATDDPPTAAKLADDALAKSLWAGEQMSAFHANVFINRRHQGGGFGRAFLGCAVPPGKPLRKLPAPVKDTFDFVRMPFVWREIQPNEQEISFDAVDGWLKACAEAKLSVRGGPLLNFRIGTVPDWMYIWENDFDTIRDYAQEHVRRCVKRYAEKIQSWVVTSGIHADNVFSFSFEQIMEITRAAAGAVREIAPRAQIVLDLAQPWGEYYARNARSIPPLLYADLAVQSGIPFDAFGLQFLFGIGADGYHLRDALQISGLIDKLANLGKPLHVTAVAVPSAQNGDAGDAGGHWHEPWSDAAQAEWLKSFCEIALSKPYVECVCLQALFDDENGIVPTGGVLRADAEEKPALAKLTELRRRLLSGATV